jgi:hypothetical protein
VGGAAQVMDGVVPDARLNLILDEARRALLLQHQRIDEA